MKYFHAVFSLVVAVTLLSGSVAADDYTPDGDTDLSFPAEVAPQYAVIDLGEGYVLDMNDHGDVLVQNGSTVQVWSAGVTHTVTTSSGGSSYYWDTLANNGTVLGSYTDEEYQSGFASWTVGGGVSSVSFASLGVSYVSGDAVLASVLYNTYLPVRDGVYYGLEFVTYTHIATDADDNDIGYDNYYDLMFRLNADGSVTHVGDTVVYAGEVSPTGGIEVSYNIATTPQGDHLTMSYTGTYTSDEICDQYVSSYVYNEETGLDDLPVYTPFSYTLTYLDDETIAGDLYFNDTSIADPDSYYGIFSLPVSAYGDTIPQPVFDGSILTNLDDVPALINPYYGVEESPNNLYSFSGGDPAAGDATGGDGYVRLVGLNSLGLGWEYYGGLWFSGVSLSLDDIFSPNQAAAYSEDPYFFFSAMSRTSNVLAGQDVVSSAEHALLFVPASLTVDSNRDGDVTLDGQDWTNEAYPFVFWVNDDRDGNSTVSGETSVEDDLDPAGGTADYVANTITKTRDLEDFARVWIDIGGLQSQVSGGNIYVGLKWVPFANMTFNGTNAPAIKLFRAYDPEGGSDYLTDSATASAQITGNYAAAIVNVDTSENSTLVQHTTNDWDFILPQSLFANLSTGNSTRCFLFECCHAGQGELTLELLYYNGTGYTKLGSGATIAFDLENIKNLYERWTVGDGDGSFTTPSSTANISTRGITGANFSSDEPGDYSYILFVHGWNVEPWERDAFAETMYKRLYWQGYQGRFGTFQWPTTYGDAFDALLGGYDDGERTAWLSAKPLEDLLTGTLASRYYPGDIYLYAHSMGNVVAGEALRLGAQDDSGDLVNTYTASQAAVPGESWDAGLTVNATLTFPFGTGPDTPDIYGDWMISDNGTAASAKVNFFNTEDYALGWWQTDQTLKPDWFPFYTYYYNDSNLTVVNGTFNTSTAADLISAEIIITAHTGVSPTVLTLGNATNALSSDRYEIMAYDAEPRSLPLGQIAGNISDWSSPLNLGSVAPGSGNLSSIWPADTFSGNHYSSHPWHSAQFRFDNMSQDKYWNILMSQFGLPTNH